MDTGTRKASSVGMRAFNNVEHGGERNNNNNNNNININNNNIYSS